MLIEEEEREAKTRREHDRQEELAEKNKKKKNKEALIDDLVKKLVNSLITICMTFPFTSTIYVRTLYITERDQRRFNLKSPNSTKVHVTCFLSMI